MQLTVDLPDQLEAELAEEAARLGLSLSEYVIRVLSTARPGESSSGQTLNSGAELVRYWQSAGLIGTRLEGVDSPELAREIRRQAERRIRE